MVKLPNFLIPGAGRSGTTALYGLLKQHPNIFLPDTKEPVYFSYPNENLTRYAYLFRNADGYDRVGEASTRYMYIKEAARRIYKFNPEMDLIFMLRDPVERAYSNYKREIQMWGETRSFEGVLKQDRKYIWPGKYYTHIKRFLDYFPQENMLFILFKDFVEDECEQLRKVCDFLGVSKINFDIGEINKNPSIPPTSILLQKCAHKLFDYDRRDPRFERKVKDYAMSAVNRLNHIVQVRDFPELKEDTELKLREYFRQEMENLEQLINRNLDQWK